MTADLQKAIEMTQALRPQQQDDLARLMMLYAGGEVDDPLCELSPAEEEALRVGLGQAERGEFAPDHKVRATWAKYER